MRFKRGKPHNTKEVGWGSPKHLQPGYQNFDEADDTPVTIPSKKPKNYCRKLKGAHQYVISEEHHYCQEPDNDWHMMWGCSIYYKCIGCGKEKLEFHREPHTVPMKPCDELTCQKDTK